jgi:hypothetical protein
MKLYEYRALENPAADIRLVTLFPGQANDDIKVSIVTDSLKNDRQPVNPEAPLQQIRASLPDGWAAQETLGGRLLYISEDLAHGTSWEHPDAQLCTLARSKTDNDEPLANMPEYEAVSYIWGCPDVKKTIFVRVSESKESPEFAKIFVRRNLYNALQHLRQPDVTRTLWVDFISINQSDLRERNEQVARMKDIFRLARRVLVWLGRGTDESRDAMRTIEYIGRQVVSTVDRRIMPAPDAEEPTWYLPSCHLPFSDTTWKAVGDILRRAWFERLWIVQEIHLPRKALILCGKDQVDWLYFREAVLVLWYNREGLFKLPTTRLRFAGQLAECQPGKHPISDTLSQVYGRFCSEGHDRVYGIHGLFPPSFSSLILPSYTRSVDFVWEDFTVRHISYSRRLELLRLCHLDSRNANRPSWVPDFSAALKLSRRMDWQLTAGYSAAEAKYDETCHGLQVEGVLCATVSGTADPLTENMSLLDCVAAVRRWAPSNLDSGRYPNGESVRDAFARTLVGNCVSDRLPQRKNEIALETWTAQESPTALFGAGAAGPIAEGAVLTASEKFALSLVTGRTFVTTSEGYFGLGPLVARPGLCRLRFPFSSFSFFLLVSAGD